MTDTDSTNGKWAYWAMAFCVMAYFIWFVYSRALNIPYQDDILDILQFLLRLTEIDAAGEWVSEFLAVYNVHRTTSSRLVYYSLYLMQGQVDFRVFTVVANLTLPLIAFCYSCMVPQRKNLSLALLIAVLLLCQPGTYELVFFPVAAFSFYSMVLYAIASMLLIEKNSIFSLGMAVACAVAASFTLVSGLLVWFVAGAYLAYQTYILKSRRPVQLLFWVLAAMAILITFFADFSGSQTGGSIWRGFVQNPQHQLAYFFVLSGSGVGLSETGFALGLGLFLVVSLGWMLCRDYRTGLSSLHFITLFLLLSLAMVCLGRASLGDLDYTTHRYAFLSRNLLLCGLLLLLNRCSGRLSKYLLLTISSILWLASYALSVPQLERQLAVRVEAFNAGRYPVFYQSDKMTRNIVNEAVQRGMYVPPEKPLKAFAH